MSKAPKGAIAAPSATVVLLRDGRDGLETLLLRRSEVLSFHGGDWVFPGGRVDPGDAPGAPDLHALDVARVAAAREAEEESAVIIPPSPEILRPWSHWTTPEGWKKRFATWFFIARMPDDAVVTVDGGEVNAHRFMRPDEALRARDAGEIGLPPPTFVTLWELREHATVDAVFEAQAGRRIERILPRLQRVADGAVSLYPGDAGYDEEDLERPGPRHRLVMRKPGWRYLRSD